MADDLERQRAEYTCRDYHPLPESARCQHYAGRGACKRDDYFMCSEWLKANPGAAAAAEPEGASEPAPPKPEPKQATRLVVAKELRRHRPEPVKARGGDRNRYVLDRRPLLDIGSSEPRPLIEHPELLTEQAVAELAATGYELPFETASGVFVTLVSEYVRPDERAELRYRDARTLALIVQALDPGATLRALRMPHWPKETDAATEEKTKHG